MVVALIVMGLLRSTPMKAKFTKLNWLPVGLLAELLALSIAVRLELVGLLSTQSYAIHVDYVG